MTKSPHITDGLTLDDLLAQLERLMADDPPRDAALIYAPVQALRADNMR